MYATADLWLPHFSTGKPLNRMKPFPLRISARIEVNNADSFGKGKVSCRNVSMLPRSHSSGGANLGNASQRSLVCKKLVGGSAQLSDLFVVEYMNPSFRVIGVVLGLPDSLSLDLLREVGVVSDQVIQRRVLATGLDAVGEDFSIHRLLGRACQRVGGLWLRLKEGWCHDEYTDRYR
jgi:hypothetical protein